MSKNAKLLKRTAASASLVLLGTLLVVLLAISKWGLVWRMTNEETISHLGWTVPVPESFFRYGGERGPSLWVLDFGIPLWNAPFGHISLFELKESIDLAKDYDRFARGAAIDAHERGFSSSEDKTLSVAEYTMQCTEFLRESGYPEVLARCAIDGSRLSVFYEGNKKYLNQFYSMTQSMTPPDTNRAH